MASAMLEMQMLKIIHEIKSVAPPHMHAKEPLSRRTIMFDDLSRAMEEFGVVLRRPAFLEERAS